MGEIMRRKSPVPDGFAAADAPWHMYLHVPRVPGT